MKKYRFLLSMSLIALLAACSNDETTPETPTPAPTTETPVATPTDTTTETPTEPEPTEPATEQTDEYNIEMGIDAMAMWESFELGSDFYKNYDSDTLISEEYHESWQYVKDPVQMYASLHSIGFSNMHIEQYATESEAYMSMDMGEWEAVDTADVDFEGPILPRMGLMNIIISSEGQVSKSDTTYTVDVDPSSFMDVMNGLYEEIYSGMFDEEVDFSSMQATITHNNDHIIGLELLASGTTSEGVPVTYDFKEEYSNVNGLTSIENPAK